MRNHTCLSILSVLKGDFMILASNSLAAAPGAARRQYDLCTTSQDNVYLARTPIANWVARISHGLSAQRKVTAQQSTPAVVVAETADMQASDNPLSCLKV